MSYTNQLLRHIAIESKCFLTVSWRWVSVKNLNFMYKFFWDTRYNDFWPQIFLSSGNFILHLKRIYFKQLFSIFFLGKMLTQTLFSTLIFSTSKLVFNIEIVYLILNNGIYVTFNMYLTKQFLSCNFIIYFSKSKIFWLKIFWDSKDFWLKNLFNHTIFWPIKNVLT